MATKWESVGGAVGGREMAQLPRTFRDSVGPYNPLGETPCRFESCSRHQEAQDPAGQVPSPGPRRPAFRSRGFRGALVAIA